MRMNNERRSSQNDEFTQLLQELGLSVLEAEIYSYLLQSPPATGYRIAKALGRSFTTTYRSLESLKAQGALLSEDDKGGRFRAVAVPEFLEQLESRFRARRTQVLEAAAALPDSGRENRIYRLGSVSQIYERYRHMLRACEQSALSELSPEPIEHLRDDLAAAGRRDLRVAVRTYAGEVLEGVRTIHSPMGEATRRAVGSQWLTLFVDGRQFLMALIAHGGTEVLEAAWSESLFLARQFYSYVNSDLFLYSFTALLENARSVSELRTEYQHLLEEFPPGGDLGFRELCGEGGTQEEPDSPPKSSGD